MISILCTGTCCSGSWHAGKPSAKAKDPKPCLCPGGGCYNGKGAVDGAKDGNDKRNRVDHYGSTKHSADGQLYRGTAMEGCKAVAYWLPSGDLVAPR